MACIPHKIAVGVLVIACLNTAAWAAEFTGKVVAVLNGEVIAVEHNGRAEKIRLHGVECPDKDTRLAQRAKRYLTKMAMGQTVTVVTLESDREDRMISDVFLPDGEMLNALVIRAGFAWTDGTAYGVFSDLEDEARAARRGMWARPGFLEPAQPAPRSRPQGPKKPR